MGTHLPTIQRNIHMLYTISSKSRMDLRSIQRQLSSYYEFDVHVAYAFHECGKNQTKNQWVPRTITADSVSVERWFQSQGFWKALLPPTGARFTACCIVHRHCIHRYSLRVQWRLETTLSYSNNHFLTLSFSKKSMELSILGLLEFSSGWINDKQTGAYLFRVHHCSNNTDYEK